VTREGGMRKEEGVETIRLLGFNGRRILETREKDLPDHVKRHKRRRDGEVERGNRERWILYHDPDMSRTSDKNGC
jgi:hypothetical protein